MSQVTRPVLIADLPADNDAMQFPQSQKNVDHSVAQVHSEKMQLLLGHNMSQVTRPVLIADLPAENDALQLPWLQKNVDHSVA